MPQAIFSNGSIGKWAFLISFSFFLPLPGSQGEETSGPAASRSRQRPLPHRLQPAAAAPQPLAQQLHAAVPQVFVPSQVQLFQGGVYAENGGQSPAAGACELTLVKPAREVRRGATGLGTAAPPHGHTDQALAEIATTGDVHKAGWSSRTASREPENSPSPRAASRGGTWSSSPCSKETRPGWLGFPCFPVSPGREERHTLMSLIYSLIFPRLDKAGGWVTASPPFAVFP